MEVSVSGSMLHQMSTATMSPWIQQMHPISHEVLAMKSALLLVLISVTQHVIAMAVRNQPNSVESQRPLKFVSKTLLFCSFTVMVINSNFRYTICISIASVIVILQSRIFSLVLFSDLQSQLTWWKAW